MQSFLIEVYSPRGGDEDFRAAAARLRRAAKALTREGTAVRYRRSFFLPTEETCFHILEGTSPGAVTQAARRAAIDNGRVLETLQ